MASAIEPTSYTSAAEAFAAIQTLMAARDARWAAGQSAQDIDAELDRAWAAWRQLVARERQTPIHPSTPGVSMSIVTFSRRPHIKLNAEKAAAIRAAKPRTRAERIALAAQHGVSEDTIRAVLNNRIWKDQAEA